MARNKKMNYEQCSISCLNTYYSITHCNKYPLIATCWIKHFVIAVKFVCVVVKDGALNGQAIHYMLENIKCNLKILYSYNMAVSKWKGKFKQFIRLHWPIFVVCAFYAMNTSVLIANETFTF